MNSIKSLEIIGLKKFKHFTIEFNEKLNIIIGENESGKSTIIEALSIIINQQYKNSDKYIIKELLNKENVNNFYSNPCIENLPKIIIEIEFNISPDKENAFSFYGMVNMSEKEKYGIQFRCEFDQQNFGDSLIGKIREGIIPYEYYQMAWNTFQGESYNSLKRPISYLSIDNSSLDSNNTFNYYNKSLFNNKFLEDQKMEIRNDFRNNLDKIFFQLNLDKLNENQKFGINNKKILFENIITILDDDIPLENKGKGIENLVKTQIALDKEKSKLDVISIEEPENHLSHTNLRKMIKEIQNSKEKSQLIITTHNNLIVNGLNLENIQWISENKTINLKSIDPKISDFFQKVDNNNLLQFILASKVILVEGATEYLLLPKIYKEHIGRSHIDDKIDIISCNGVTYKNYLEIANSMNKKVAVITDNDGNSKNIEYMNKINSTTGNIQIFMDKNIDNWTWEVCIYNLNKTIIKNLIDVEEKAKYIFHKIEYEQHLGKMLNNKAETAYLILNSKEAISYPDYVKDAITWISE